MHDRLPDYVPGCTVIMFGCAPWTNTPGIVGDCPVCKAGIRPCDDSYYCEKCGSVSPRVAARIRAARIGLKRRDKVETAEKKARAKLAKQSVLTESERRRLWNGYRGTILAEFAGDLPNHAKEGRDWLASTGQAPDWTLTLDRRGRVTGRTCGLPPEG